MCVVCVCVCVYSYMVSAVCMHVCVDGVWCCDSYPDIRCDPPPKGCYLMLNIPCDRLVGGSGCNAWLAECVRLPHCCGPEQECSVQNKSVVCVCQWFRTGEGGVCVSGSEQERVVCVSVVQSRREWRVCVSGSEQEKVVCESVVQSR